MRIGILGYGNLGRGVECAIKQKSGHGACRSVHQTCAGECIYFDKERRGLLCE